MAAESNPPPAPAPAPPSISPAPPAPPANNNQQYTQQPSGNTPPGAGQTAQQPDWTGMLFPLMAMGILFWLFIIRPETKRRKEKDAIMNSLKVKDEVVTIFGLYGTIVSIDGEDVILNIDPDGNKKDMKMRLRRSAIDSVVAKVEKK